MKRLSICLLSLLFLTIGTFHFRRPEPFVEIVPRYFLHPLFLVYLSGFFEILGGIGLLIPRVRRWAGYGLMLLLLCVLPANIYMFTDHPVILATEVPKWVLAVRLPLQFVLMYWIYWATRPKK